MQRAQSALLLAPRTLPAEHQQLELGPVLPEKGHGAQCDKEISLLSSGWPLSTGEGVMRRTCTPRCRNGTFTWHLIHHLPEAAGGDVTW